MVYDPQAPSIDDDYVAWGKHQATLLREGAFERMDLQHLVEEWEWCVGKERRELIHRLRLLIMDLLKCECQPHLRSNSWLTTILNQRVEIRMLLEDSPSLAPELMPLARREYPRAVHLAMDETHLPATTFPAELPYSREQLLDLGFKP